MFGGIDWASADHAVAVHSDDGAKRWRYAVPHSREGLNRLVAWLARFGDPAELPIAIERPDGRLVDRLLEAGHPVVPVKSTAIKSWRESEVPSGAKSDPGDADVIALSSRPPPPAAGPSPVRRGHQGPAGGGAYP